MGFPQQYETGHPSRLTVTISGAPIGTDSTYLSLYHRFLGPDTQTAVTSAKATQGDSATQWYAVVNMPASTGLYLAEWTSVNTTGAVVVRELIEVVQTQAAETQGPEYATPDQLLRRYPLLQTARSRPMEDWRGYIRRAQHVIDARLAGRFTVPLGSQNSGNVPPQIEELALAGAFALYMDETRPGEQSFGRLYRRFLDELRALASGDATLISSGGGAVATASTDTITSTTQDYTPTFGVGSVIDEEVDPDRIDDEEDARD